MRPLLSLCAAIQARYDVGASMFDEPLCSDVAELSTRTAEIEVLANQRDVLRMALRALADANWLDYDPFDTEELAQAKAQARRALESTR